MEVVVVWALLALALGWLATERGRSGVGFCLLPIVLSPLIGFVAVLVLPNLARREEEEREKLEAERKSKQENERQHDASPQARTRPEMGGGDPSAPSSSCQKTEQAHEYRNSLWALCP